MMSQLSEFTNFTPIIDGEKRESDENLSLKSVDAMTLEEMRAEALTQCVLHTITKEELSVSYSVQKLLQFPLTPAAIVAATISLAAMIFKVPPEIVMGALGADVGWTGLKIIQGGQRKISAYRKLRRIHARIADIVDREDVDPSIRDVFDSLSLNINEFRS